MFWFGLVKRRCFIGKAKRPSGSNGVNPFIRIALIDLHEQLQSLPRRPSDFIIIAFNGDHRDMCRALRIALACSIIVARSVRK